MKIGGYQIIDLQDKELVTDTPMQYEGIYDLLESTRKPVMLCGITIDGNEYHNTYAEFKVNGSQFEATIYGKKIAVTDLDIVTITNLE